MIGSQANFMQQIRRMTTITLLLIVLFGPGPQLTTVPAQSLKPDAKAAPIRLDFDMESIPEPREVDTGYLYDWVDNTAFQPVKQGLDVPRHLRRLTGRRLEALNVNALDEVPDSSWFTNRNNRRRLSLEEIRRGPDGTTGPVEGELTVIRAKTIGVAPGFWVRDGAGQIYILKLDPPANPELMTGAEVIATKLFYAIGYNVPQNTIFRFRRADLSVDPTAKVTDERGQKRLMNVRDLDVILQRAARGRDGSFRAVASRLLEGKPKGGFTFGGLRPDDPNDIIPHERRRDLRGLRVFSAWLNHDDIRVGNTLDMYVAEGGRQFLRHYLIDFGSTFGSHTTRVNPPEVGHEHVLDLSTAAKVLVSGGIYQPAWRGERYDAVYSPAVGRYSARSFNPNKWKGNFPLVAFEEMTTRDAFWAAQIIASFTPEQIRAAVQIAEFSDPADAEHLTREIIRRQRIIVSRYARERSGLAEFAIEVAFGGEALLSFTDYRLSYDDEEELPKFGGYSYRLQSIGRMPQLIAEGMLSEPRLVLAPETVRQMRQSGTAGAESSGVAELVIEQANERQTAQVYLFAGEDGRVRIIGLRL